MKRVVMFSGGAGSWAAAKRVAAQYGTADMTLLFTDTKSEDPDLYRFIYEAARNVGVPLTTIAEGRTVWELFFDEKMMGSSRVDLCSRVLKRELADKWLAEHFTAEDTTVYVGIDWTEEHRILRLAERKKPWRYEAPLCNPPYITKLDIITMLKQQGIEPPRMYGLGFAHNNCFGGCVKAGLGHWANLLRTMPEQYAMHERKEEEFRALVGKDVSILRRQTPQGTFPVTLKQHREELQAGGQCDMFDIGGCGCFSEVPDVD
jgi:hypothetical protein